MNENETLVLDKLQAIVNHVKELNEVEPAFGEMLMFGVRMAMDMYEASAKEAEYLANDAVEFIASSQDMTVHDLLLKSYPQDSNPKPTADEDLTQFIMDSAKSYETDIEEYREAIGTLVSDFKAVAKASRG